MDTPLPFLTLMGIRIHLLMCRYCLRFSHQLKLLRKMSRHDEGGTLPPELPNQLSQDARERIKDSIRARP